MLALLVGLAALDALVLTERFAYHNPSLRATIETAVVLMLLLSAWLLRGQFLLTRRLSDLLVPAAVLMLGLADLVFVAAPEMLGFQAAGGGVADLFLARLLVATCLASAAVSPSSKIAPRSRVPLLVVVAAVACVAGLALGALVFGGSPWSASRGRSAVSTGDLILVVEAAAMLLLAAGAFIGRLRGPTAAILAMFAILMAGAWLYPAVAPTLPGTVSGADLLRLIADGLLLATALRTYAENRRRAENQAAARERHRLAHDLHDGLAQDLAFIVAHAQRLARDLGQDHPVVLAAQRALAVSRGAITDLSAADEPTLEAALQAVSFEVSSRYDVQIQVRADDVRLSRGDRDELVRITREAIMNAVQHGKARRVTVSVRNSGHRLVLRVTDDGAGIGDMVASQPDRGFGMKAMIERAEAVGGRLRAGPRAGGGTEVKVVV